MNPNDQQLPDSTQHTSSNQSTQQPPSTASARTQSGENARMRHPMYWLTVVAIISVYWGALSLLYLANVSGLVFSVPVILVVLIALVIHVKKLKRANRTMLSKKDKYISVVLMTLDVLIGQAVYYYTLRKTQPENAKTFNKMGWKILGIAMLMLVVLYFFMTVGNLTGKTWYKKNGDAFVTAYNAIRQDLVGISSAVELADDNAALGACQQLSKNVAALQALPDYPIEETRQTLDTAASDLAQAAKDCEDGINNQDETTFATSATRALDGVKKLNTAYGAIQKEHDSNK